ncbi:hypothetical protein AURANDRAFT_69064, partial [Aureococcus anophagefferens]
YPQHVVIELAQDAIISQIQLLSHQNKIATRVELFVGSGTCGTEPSLWTRLGYMSLDPNERSQHQARELKSVYVDAKGRYLKFVMHCCHVLGEYVKNSINSANERNPEKPSSSLPRRERVDDLAFDMNVDPRAGRLIRSLLIAKQTAIEAEDYDAAKRIKAAEQELQALGGQLAQLEISKRVAVRDEDYDRAKLLKHEDTCS